MFANSSWPKWARLASAAKWWVLQFCALGTEPPAAKAGDGRVGNSKKFGEKRFALLHTCELNVPQEEVPPGNDVSSQLLFWRFAISSFKLLACQGHLIDVQKIPGFMDSGLACYVIAQKSTVTMKVDVWLPFKPESMRLQYSIFASCVYVMPGLSTQSVVFDILAWMQPVSGILGTLVRHYPRMSLIHCIKSKVGGDSNSMEQLAMVHGRYSSPCLKGIHSYLEKKIRCYHCLSRKLLQQLELYLL